MSCYRFDLHRKYVHYLHGLLPSLVDLKIEKHLAKCAECTTRVDTLKSTEKLLKELPHHIPVNDPWLKIQNALRHNGWISESPLWRKVAVVTIFGLISGLLGAATYGKLSDHESFLESSFRPDEFKPVPITRMSESTEPHVVTEGYVKEARVEENDGDRVFKLVEKLNGSGPFVICEVIEPLDLPIPPVGSRVRVYGVSRFDGKSDHNWQEVHPVLNIEILKN